MPWVNIDYYTKRTYTPLENGQNLEKRIFGVLLKEVMLIAIDIYGDKIEGHDDFLYFDKIIETAKVERYLVEGLKSDDTIFTAELYDYVWKFARKAIAMAKQRNYITYVQSSLGPGITNGTGSWRSGDLIPNNWAIVYNLICDTLANKRVERDYELEGRYSYYDRWGWYYQWERVSGEWTKTPATPGGMGTWDEPYTYVQTPLPDGSVITEIQLLDGSIVPYDFFRRPNRPKKPWAPYNNS